MYADYSYAQPSRHGLLYRLAVVHLGNGIELARFYALAAQKLLDMLPSDLRPAYDEALSPSDPGIEELVSAADKLSAHIKCLEELKAGNSEFKKAAEQTRAAVRSAGAAVLLRGVSAEL